MKIMKDSVKTFILAILAGISIGIGGCAYLLCESKLVGAFVFPVGITLVIMFGMCLYTGMIGYLFENKSVYILKLLLAFVGNFVGTWIVAGLLGLTRIGNKLRMAADAVVGIKSEDGFLSLMILGIFCGLLVFTGVDIFKKNSDKKDSTSVIALFVCIAAFIIAGFEHCVADMFYYLAAEKLTEGIVPILAVALGNSLGGLLIPVCKIVVDKMSKNEN